MGKMKGQNQIFEQVMLFAIGVLIFIICFSSFGAYQGYFTETGKYDQLIQVRDYIAYSIAKSSLQMNSSGSYSRIEIPKTIGGYIYRIRLSNNGLNVSLISSSESSFTGLYGLNMTTEMSPGEATSSSGSIVLYKSGNKIILT